MVDMKDRDIHMGICGGADLITDLDDKMIRSFVLDMGRSTDDTLSIHGSPARPADESER